MIQRLGAITALALLLAACQATGQAGHVTDQHTGLNMVHSQRFAVANGLLHNLNAHAFHEEEIGFGVYYQYTATGVGWMFINSAWSSGKKLRLARTKQDVLGCGGGSCSIQETGFILLTPEEFYRYAQTGFEFKLLGRNDEVVGKMPSHAFQQVIDRLAGRS